MSAFSLAEATQILRATPGVLRALGEALPRKRRAVGSVLTIMDRAEG